MDREEPHHSNYQGCRHAKEEIQKGKLQRAPKTATGRVFSSSHTTPGLSFKFHKDEFTHSKVDKGGYTDTMS
jgi:hypothetical protein